MWKAREESIIWVHFSGVRALVNDSVVVALSVVGWPLALLDAVFDATAGAVRVRVLVFV